MSQKEHLLLKELCREIAEENQKFDNFFKLLSINHQNLEQTSEKSNQRKSISKANSRWKKKQMLH